MICIGIQNILFEPYNWIPTTHTLSTLNYYSTPKPCAMYVKCVGKFLQCVNYTIKEII